MRPKVEETEAYKSHLKHHMHFSVFHLPVGKNMHKGFLAGSCQ
jgi:hypothetical protein